MEEKLRWYEMVNTPLCTFHYRVLYIPAGCLGFLPSTVSQDWDVYLPRKRKQLVILLRVQKSQTTTGWIYKKPVNNGRTHISTGAESLPSTVPPREFL